MTETVMITGASAGIGRATARLYGQRGANVGLIARGQARPGRSGPGCRRRGREGARGRGRRGQLRAGAGGGQPGGGVLRPDRRLDQRGLHLGFRAVRRHLRRGVPAGHRGQLPGIRARDDGGAGPDEAPRAGHHCAGRVRSGLAEHPPAVGLLRREARHQRVHLLGAMRTAARALRRSCHGRADARREHPAVLLGALQAARQQQPVPPIYQPEIAARGVVFAADHRRRKEYWVGAATAATIAANKVVPALLDRYLARTGYDSQQTGQKIEGGRRDNLWQASTGRAGATMARTASLTTGPTPGACSCGWTSGQRVGAGHMAGAGQHPVRGGPARPEPRSVTGLRPRGGRHQRLPGSLPHAAGSCKAVAGSAATGRECCATCVRYARHWRHCRC